MDHGLAFLDLKYSSDCSCHSLVIVFGGWPGVMALIPKKRAKEPAIPMKTPLAILAASPGGWIGRRGPQAPYEMYHAAFFSAVVSSVHGSFWRSASLLTISCLSDCGKPSHLFSSSMIAALEIGLAAAVEVGADAEAVAKVLLAKTCKVCLVAMELNIVKLCPVCVGVF